MRKVLVIALFFALVLAWPLTGCAVRWDSETAETVKQSVEPIEAPVQWHVDMGDQILGQSSYETMFGRDLIIEYVAGKPITVNVWAAVRITAGASWAQIDKVLYCGQDSDVYEGYTLMPMGSYNGSSKFPTIAAKIDVNGIITIESGNTLELSYSDLEDAGFNMLGNEDSWIAQKSYNTTTTFRVMD